MSRTSRERFAHLRQSFWRHPRVTSVSKSARWVYAAGLSYCADAESDGFIAERAAVVMLAEGSKRDVQELVTAGLWAVTDGGYSVSGYLEHNKSKADMQAAREKMGKGGAKGGGSNRLPNATSQVQPTKQGTLLPTKQGESKVRATEEEEEREEEATTPKGVCGTPAPSEPIRRRDVHDYQGAEATAAQVALSAACQAAGGAPRPRGGFAQQQAWSQVACDAHELSEALQRPVAEVLAVSATGFVASRGVQASPVWWAEDFARYYDAGCKGAPRKAGSMTPLPKPEDYRPTTDEELDAMFGPEVSA